MLKDVGAGEDRTAIAARVLALADQASDRAQMIALLERLKTETGVMKDVAADLAQLLPDLPDGSLPSRLALPLRTDQPRSSRRPEKTLERLNALRHNLLAAGNARLWIVGSRANLDQLQTPLASLTGDFNAIAAPQPSITMRAPDRSAPARSSGRHRRAAIRGPVRFQSDRRRDGDDPAVRVL